jgi:hypothetical protein
MTRPDNVPPALWAAYTAREREFVIEHEKLHELFQARALIERLAAMPTTSDMSKQEMTDLLELIGAFGAQQGVRFRDLEGEAA